MYHIFSTVDIISTDPCAAPLFVSLPCENSPSTPILSYLLNFFFMLGRFPERIQYNHLNLQAL